MSDLNLIVRNGKQPGRGGDWKASVTKKQAEIILAVTSGTDLGWEDLGAYVASGDLTHMSDATHAELTKLVKQCQERAENESQARRYWPRKVASVILHGA